MTTRYLEEESEPKLYDIVAAYIRLRYSTHIYIGKRRQH